jgi:quinoprotein glucose dehydrogenase
MLCRIQFERSRYSGRYTPPGLGRAIGYPVSAGIVQWGGGAVDPTRSVLVVSTTEMPYLTQMVRRAADRSAPALEWQFEMAGTPYRYSTAPMLSSLELPCKQPPWGSLVAVDLRTGDIIWRKSLGTSRENGPFGIPSVLPLPVGTPNIGGNIVLGSGVVFIGAATDSYFRAFDISDGREIWRASLPASANATPMSYVSKQTGRQFIVVAAGGHAYLHSRSGDYVVAFALRK